MAAPKPNSQDPQQRATPPVAAAGSDWSADTFSPFHFERRGEPLASRSRFRARLVRNGLWGAAIIALSLLLGMTGYMGCEGMATIDAFLNAAMILSGMGPVGELQTTCGKIFAGSYALYSGLLLIGVAGLVFAPIMHRVLHRFHVQDSSR